MIDEPKIGCFEKQAAPVWAKYLRGLLGRGNTAGVNRFLEKAAPHTYLSSASAAVPGAKLFRSLEGDMAASGIYKMQGGKLYRDAAGRHYLANGTQARLNHDENMAADAALSQRNDYVKNIGSTIQRMGDNAMPLGTNQVAYASNTVKYPVGNPAELAKKLGMQIRDAAGHAGNSRSILYGSEGARFVPYQGRAYIPGRSDYAAYLNEAISAGRVPSYWAGDPKMARLVGRSAAAHEFSHGRVAGGAFRGHNPYSEDATAVAAMKDIIPVNRMLRKAGYRLPGEFESVKPMLGGKYNNPVQTRSTLLNEMGNQSRAHASDSTTRDLTSALLDSDLSAIQRASFHPEFLRDLARVADRRSSLDMQGAAGLLQGALNYHGHLPVLPRRGFLPE
ncbi:MAG: hypothetical protein MJZ17_05120 [Bacteroidales bacterium]|nr:hypothetical protein [Bacteroidales bacterium]